MDEFIPEQWGAMNSSFPELLESGKAGLNRTVDPNIVGSYEYIFDRTDIRITFLTLYTIVFCSCFFGNLMVILVVCLHWRMRSITNFCLANLAFADLCVGIFCVYQHIFYYMTENWIFGDLMCKMHHFVSSLSTTASILILVVICIERYLAIIHPMRCKQWLTLTRLRLTILGVWAISALISSPRFYYFKTVEHSYDGKSETLCIPDRNVYDSRIVDMVSMALLFVLPLAIISGLYFRIGIVLWKSSNASMPSTSSTSLESSSSSCRCDTNGTIGHTLSRGPNAPGQDRNRILSQFWTCVTCKSPHRSRQKPNIGSFCSSAEQPLNCPPFNLPIINGLGNDDFHSRGRGNGRNINDLVITCNPDSSLPSIKSTSFVQRPNPSVIQSHHSETVNIQCCSCTNIASRETASVPVSPYIKRELTPLSSPAVTEPIVVVKFQKKSSLKKFRRTQCTILMKSALIENNLEENGHSCPNCGAFAGAMINGCSVCRISGDELRNCGIQGDPCSNYRSIDGECDRNEECTSHSPHHHCTTSCKNASTAPFIPAGYQCSNAKGIESTCTSTPPTSKGPKRMRVVRGSKYGTRALQCRRRIIRMLIVIVVVFAACHLPLHARKIWQYWGKGYKAGSVFSDLFTPITFLITYAQSGINPILYAFMSRKFRSSFADLLCCNMRRSLKISRNLSVRSTNAIQLSQGP